MMKSGPVQFQVVGKNPQSRMDHVWFKAGFEEAYYKCCLCGAVAKTPPPYPTPADWLPERYERLLPSERALLPYVSGRTFLGS